MRTTSLRVEHHWVLLLVVLSTRAEQAQPEQLIITATAGQSSFDLPVSSSRIDGQVLQTGRQEVNLSESLARVPGVMAQNRQNYAQDVQIAIRGFGARSTFGVRGIRLYADGIPATLPDGQGQVTHFDLSSAGHIDILRGPFSALYGNSSGGVIAIASEEATTDTTLNVGVSAASFGSERYALKVSGGSAVTNYVLSGSRFDTHGYRQHSAARRDTVNGKVAFTLSERARLTLVANAMQLDAEDPLGLTLAQWQSNPQQAGTRALNFNTRKAVTQQQLGATYQLAVNDDNALRIMAYGGQRDTSQFQAIPTLNQLPVTSAGGVIDLERDYLGGDLRWTHTLQLAGGPATITAGLSADQVHETRRGYENFIGDQLGVQGTLRRDEANTLANVDQYVQMQWQARPQWLLLVGARHSQVRFVSRDHYLVSGNGDDSGQRRYHAITPVAGVTWQLTNSVNMYAAYGQGFETPTFNELAYRSVDGTQTGLNLDLDAARSRHVEWGVKSKPIPGMTLSAALFRSDTDRELAVLANAGGRAVYQNIAVTRRDGVELEATNELPKHFTSLLTYTYLRARYQTAFTSCSALPCVPAAVEAGNRIPGIAMHTAYAEVTWRHPRQGVAMTLEGRYGSGLFADDRNAVPVSGQLVMNWLLTLEQQLPRWRVQEYVRLDNLADRRYIGSVIVNESNQRYLEPAPGRNWLAGVKFTAAF